MLTEGLTELIETALADRVPLTLTLREVQDLAAQTGIADPHEIREPVAFVPAEGPYPPLHRSGS